MLWIPFSSDRKRMTVAYALNDNVVRLVVKGAPEYVVPMCNSKLNDFNQAEGFNDKESYLRDVIE
jgi:magnesium-transporting ATPase (P-type)